uniref:C2H2-type domain-containing protein n=1 Tax=Rhodosorus marinus TaxID=101924 RepID=A0A7S3EMP4_9RHOD|mmetsp:Transcript_6629/g.28275  ORF Transcript_6629/g.28275 Transcript_6629/m.28275 type:complete len:168 (+) Transcript_6629:88-591(+)
MDCLDLSYGVETWDDWEDSSTTVPSLNIVDEFENAVVADGIMNEVLCDSPPPAFGLEISREFEDEFCTSDFESSSESSSCTIPVYEKQKISQRCGAAVSRSSKKRVYKKEECPVCNEVFFRRHEMMRHLKASHLKIKPFQCSFCPKKFARTSHVKSHESRIHLKPTA